MNTKEVLGWLEKGLNISDGLSSLKANNVDGKTITQMDIRNLKKYMSTDSALKVYKAISVSTEKDLLSLEIENTDVVKECELQPLEKFFVKGTIIAETVEKSIISMFGENISGDLSELKHELVNSDELTDVCKKYKLSNEEMIIILFFVQGLVKNTYSCKVLKPFYSRTPASFFKCKAFILRLLSVLRKLPSPTEESTYLALSKQKADFFRVGETYSYPSFGFSYSIGDNGIDNVVDDDDEGAILKVHGKPRGFKFNDILSNVDDEDMCTHLH